MSVANPTPCRIVLYHWRAETPGGQLEFRSRPAVVTSVGASDDVLNLFVFFEPSDLEDPYAPPAMNQFSVSPWDPANPQTHRWSWPPRN